MFKPKSTRFLAVKTSILQIYTKFYRNALEKKIFPLIQGHTPKLGKPILSNFFVLLRIFEAVQVLDKLKSLRHAPFKFIKKSRAVTCDNLKPD